MKIAGIMEKSSKKQHDIAKMRPFIGSIKFGPMNFFKSGESSMDQLVISEFSAKNSDQPMKFIKCFFVLFGVIRYETKKQPATNPNVLFESLS